MQTPTLRILLVPLAAAFLNAQPDTGSSDGRGGLRQPVKPAELKPELTAEQRADIYMARKMYREAIDLYRSIKPETAITMNKIGIAHYQMMDIGNARRHYERAVKMNSKYSEAVNNLGTIHYAQKSYRRAIGYYRRALTLAPMSASIYSNLGTAYFARKKYEDAAKAYEKALELDPEVFEHRGSYGVMLQERSVEEKAKFHFYLAKTYAKAGQNDRALLYIRKAIEEGFKDKRQLTESGEFAAMQALPEFQELLKLEPRVL